MTRAVGPTSVHSLFNPYGLYSLNGYNYINNWVANSVLKRATNDVDANILLMTIPSKMPEISISSF